MFSTQAESAAEVGKVREGDGPCAQTSTVSQPRKTEEHEEESEAEEVSSVCLGLLTSRA